MENKIYKFEGVSEFEKYYSEDNFYGAYNMSIHDNLPHSKEYNGFSIDGEENKKYFINIAGNMQRLYLGCKYEMSATLDFNKRYNCWQYTPVNVKTIKPSSKEDVQKFLDTIITKEQSNILINAYPNIIDIILNNGDIDLSKTKGIKEKTFNKIKEKVIDSYGMSDLLIMLQPLGITLKTIEKIKMLENNTEILKQKIENNPYILTKIKGLGFKKVDGIAMKINPKIRISIERLKAFLIYFFEDLGSKKGDTLCSLSELKKEVSNIIPECMDLYNKFIHSKNKLLYIEDDVVGLYRYKTNEFAVLNILNKIDTYSTDLTNDIDYENILLDTQRRIGFDFTDEQKNAVISTLSHGVTLITAKSGSGKTTSINGIIDLYKDSCELSLCSLSAKASRRMTEATGREASTIHKLLGFGKSEKENEMFLYNAENPLSSDVIIIDEASMCNVEMFLALLRAIKPTGKIIIVFDSEQLPPIGYGNIATDLLNSDFNICKLTKVHRQALESGILVDGNKIREQISPIKQPSVKEIHGKLQDMCYMFRNDREQIRDILVKQYLKYSKEVGIENCVIIVPRKQECINSIREINKIIQDKLIPNPNGLNRGDTIFKKGARIIQKVNDSDKGIINGELGYITSIYKKESKDKEKTQDCFTVKFDGNDNVIEYTRNDLSDIELGYALTIHSSQGSEYNTVLVGIDNTHFSLLNSNLLYTAITRAKKRCLLSGEPSAFQTCIRKKANRRKTWLNKYFNNKEF
ncbi:AAA family ATPase [Clostridium butyricum]|uniref:AAA family ATPase n=1 Tax=Clostridium butyricum TaxID=1492 RepID=UPI00325B777E